MHLPTCRDRACRPTEKVYVNLIIIRWRTLIPPNLSYKFTIILKKTLLTSSIKFWFSGRLLFNPKNMRYYRTLHLDTNYSKCTVLLLLFYISQSHQGLQKLTNSIHKAECERSLVCSNWVVLFAFCRWIFVVPILIGEYNYISQNIKHG